MTAKLTAKAMDAGGLSTHRWTMPVSLSRDPIFFIKLGFIALAVVNLRLIHREVFRSKQASLATATTPLSTKAKTLASTSLVFWTLAIVTGRMMAYPGFIRWATAGALLIVAVVALLAGFIATRRLGRSKPIGQNV